ncbi:MAG: GNAT family N-acetyltransferase [Spirochaetia bacterium]
MNTLVYRVLPTDLEEELEVWYERLICSDPEYSEIDRWDDPDYTLITFEGSQWASTAELAERNVRAGTVPVRIAGVSGVMTHPDYRGRGLARDLMIRVMELAAERFPDADFGLLDCRNEVVGFYEPLGWRREPGRIFYTLDGRRGMYDPEHVNIMIYPLKAGAEWPGGDVDFLGLPW